MTLHGRIENGVTVISDCYQPEPLSPEYSKSRAPLTGRIFAWLCVLAAIGGALWAVNP